MRLTKRILRWTALIIAVTAALVFAGALLVQTFLSSFLQDYAQSELGWNLKIGSAQIQFRPLTVRLERIELASRDQKKFFQAKSVLVRLPYSSFWRKRFVVHELSLEAPVVDLDSLPARTQASNQSSQGTKAFQIDQAFLHQGEVQFRNHRFTQINLDSSINSEEATVRKLELNYRDITLTASGDIKNLSNPDLDFEYAVKGESADFAPLLELKPDWKGAVLANGSLKGEWRELVVSGLAESSQLQIENSAPFSVSARYRYSLGNESKPISVTVTFASLPAELIRNYVQDIPKFSSVGRGTVEYSGGTNFWNGNGKFEISLLDAPKAGAIPVSGQIRGRLQKGLLLIDPSNLLLSHSQVAFSGTLSPDRLAIDADFQSSNLKDLVFVSQEFSSVPGAYKVRAQLNGPYKNIAVSAELSGISGNSSIEAKGTTSLGTQSLSIQFHGTAHARELQPYVSELHAGEFQMEGSVDGTWKNPALNASLHGIDVQISKVKLKEFSAEVETKANNLQFHANVPDFQLTAEGNYRVDTGVYEIHGTSEGAELETILAITNPEESSVHGQIYADFDAAGNIHRWRESRATVQLKAEQIQWKEVLVSVPGAEIHIEKKAAHMEASVESANVHLQLNGTASLQNGFPLDLHMTGDINGNVLEQISADWKGNGEFNFDATITGPAGNPKIDASLNTENFSAEYLPQKWNVLLQQMQAKLSSRHVSVDCTGKLNDSAFLCKGDIPLENEEGSVHLEVAGLPLSMFAPVQNLSGNLNLTADLHGKGFPLREWKAGQTVDLPFQDWIGKVSVSPADLKFGTTSLLIAEPVSFTIQNHEVLLSPTEISSGDLLKFLASGRLNLTTGKLDAMVRLDSELELLTSLDPDIQSSGPLSADFRIQGTLNNPEFSGTIQLSKASLRIPDSPITLEEMDFQASLDNKSLRIEKLQGRSGGGVVTGEGELIFGKKESEVRLQGKNVAANYPEGLRSQVDFDLKLSGTQTGALLSGDIRVLRSLYDQQLTLRNPIVRKLLAATSELSTQKQFKNRIKLDLSIQTVHDLLLKNNLAIVRAGGDLKVGGTLYRPRLNGRISIRQGSRIFLLGNQYYVEKATVEFFGSDVIEPNFDVEISTLLRDFNTDTYYEVFLPFSGSASNIEFKNVRSTPSLSQDQIFSLVTAGTVESDQPSSGRAVFQRQLLTFLAGQAISAPTAAIAKSVGLSRIQVQQEGLSSVNDPKTRLNLGKDIGAGFSLIYSFVLNDPQDQTWIATYRYGRNVIGRFIDQDDGTYTMSVSHRIPFGPGVRSGGSFNPRRRAHLPKIASLEWENGSPLSDKQIQNIVKIETGDDYDYWSLQDRIDALKQELQKIGYIFPTVEVREKEAGPDEVSLAIAIRAGDKSDMVFRGYEVSSKLLDRYRQMWRNGISAFVVQQMIQDDLVKQIQLSGYYRASIRSGVEKTDAKTTYYFNVTPGPQYSSVELAFHGTEHYPPHALQMDLGQLYPSSATMFREAVRKPKDFADKIRALYIQKGFLRTAVTFGDTVYSDSGKIIQPIQIKEGSQSIMDSVTADGKAIPGPLQKQVQLAKGRTFQPDALLDDEIRIQDFYESQGYQNVSVSYQLKFTQGTTDLQLSWGVDTGEIARIASISVTGNQSTRAELILKQSGLKAGDVLTLRNQSFARKRLSDLGVFREIGIEKEKTDVPGQYDVVIRVAENKRYEFQYGGRYNTNDNFDAEIRLADFNFLGRAQNLSLYARSTPDLPIFRLDYILPVTGSFWDRTRFSVFRDETDEDVRATIEGDLIKHAFTEEQSRFQFQQDQRIWNFHRLLYGFEYGHVSVDFEEPDVFPPGHFSGSGGVFRATFLADRRNDPLNATRGFFYSVDGEYAPPIAGSDIVYKKNFDQIFYYLPIGKIILASGLRAGFLWINSDNNITIAEKFRTGGSTTLRGFQNNTVVPLDDPGNNVNIFFGGNSVLILNEEIRFPIYKWFSGATFFDAGNVYENVSDFDPGNLRYSAGFGFRAGAAGFILRFDLGFNLDPREDEPHRVFHFGIGQAF